MKIILTNKTELNPIMVTGESKYVQGTNRDTLTFVFNDSVSMDELDKIFTGSNCESINIIGDDESEAIYSGYTIRAELNKKRVQINTGDSEIEAVYENRITVSMAQRTYAETQLASLTETVDVLVMESLMS